MTVTLQPKQQTLASRHTRGARNPLPEFCQELKVGQNIIVRVSNDEKDDNPDEEYFVAKIQEKARKLEEAGTYSAVFFVSSYLCR